MDKPKKVKSSPAHIGTLSTSVISLLALIRKDGHCLKLTKALSPKHGHDPLNGILGPQKVHIHFLLIYYLVTPFVYTLKFKYRRSSH